MKSASIETGRCWSQWRRASLQYGQQRGHNNRMSHLAPLSIAASRLVRLGRRILNTRAGALKHVPDYGLTDLTEIYRNLPASLHDLKRQMEGALLTYEPRIRAVDVEIDESPDLGLLVSFVLTCHLKKAGLVRFGTVFEPPGRMRVTQLRQGYVDSGGL
jgi:type VI secretion system lysozyme-like protein